jgi:hypothetical protein
MMKAARYSQFGGPEVLEIVEDALGLEAGFWNLVANGATFKSIGRRRTKLGRQLIADHRAELNEGEGIVNLHLAAWCNGDRHRSGRRWMPCWPGGGRS